MSTEPLGGTGSAIARAEDLPEGTDGSAANADLDEAGRVSTTRAEAAVGLRIHGASWSEIAKTLSFASPRHARVVVERTLAEDAGDNPGGRVAMRDLMDRRLNRLLRSVMPRATDPSDEQHLPYQRAALGLLDRMIRLHGLDAPTETIIHTPEATKIESFVHDLLAMSRAGEAAEEADIIDVEEISS